MSPGADSLRAACTIVARNYLAQARVLAGSWSAHHPESRLQVLVVDDLDHDVGRGEPFDVLRPEALDLTPEAWEQMAFIYDVTELATAAKPSLLRTLLRRHGGPVTYLDPDTEVFAPLRAAAELSDAHPIVLTPHTTVPMARDGCGPTEAGIMAAGVYNLGFITVGEGSEPFLDWWAERLRWDAVIDFERMLFTDQRWVDLAPGYFDVGILRDPGYNVAYWNLDHRVLRRGGAGWEVDGHPLTLFHFSGYHPASAHILSRHQGDRPRVLLSERPDLVELLAHYGERLRAAADAVPVEYGYSRLPGGIRIDRRMRRLYRADRLGERPATAPARPFSARGEADLLAWLTGPPPRANRRLPATRYLTAVYEERPDLRAEFPVPGDDDARRFLDWARTVGVAEMGLSPELLAEDPPPLEQPAWAPADRLRAGIVVAGYLAAELGIGEAGRSLVHATEAAELPCSTFVFGATNSRQQHPFAGRQALTDLDTNVICVAADQLPHFADFVGPAFFEGRSNVGVWFWELEEFPDEWVGVAELVEEIWVASEFGAAALRAKIAKPVHVFPMPVPRPAASPSVTRAQLGLPEGPYFLFMFDFFSIVERKNPLGLVEAFRRAFGPGEGPTLVIKSVNGDRRVLDRERLRLAAAGRPDIVLLEHYMSAPERDTLLAGADCYVSLHRSEGFGLTLAESMALGKPVVATGYSGNTDFMNERNSYLVPFEFEDVPAGCEPYPAGSRWARPDTGAAAALLREVWERPEAAASTGRRAAASVARRHSVAAGARFVEDRFVEIQDRRSERLLRGLAQAEAVRRADLGVSDRVRHALVRRAPTVSRMARQGLDRARPTPPRRP